MIILKILFLVALISLMVLMLIGINYFVAKEAPADSEEQPEARMRRDVEKDDRVITAMSVFSEFLARDRRNATRSQRYDK